MRHMNCAIENNSFIVVQLANDVTFVRFQRDRLRFITIGEQAVTIASVAPSKLKLKNLFIIILSHLMLRPSHLEPTKPPTVDKIS